MTQEIKISFEHIKNNCKTLREVIKLEEELKEQK
jgi:hypothetical protein